MTQVLDGIQILQEEFEDTKGVIRILKSKKGRQHNGQQKMDEITNTISKPLHRNLKIEQHEPHEKPG